GQITFEMAMNYVDDFVTVSTDEICSAIKKIYEEFRVVLEPAGALSLAGLLKYCAEHKLTGKKLVCISSGANMNFQRLQFVAERTLTGEGKEALYAIRLEEYPGTLNEFCNRGLKDKSITEFNYRINSPTEAHIFLGIAINDEKDKTGFEAGLKKSGYEFTDLTGNELAKLHVRHMVGGVSPHAVNEKIYRVEFPERPQALGEFLQLISGRWNISLFHYRNHGTDFGRVLIGLQIPETDSKHFQEFLLNNKYHFREESDNTAYALFLKKKM
ncbi:MAG: pyridoxal-phosphate dependent enzyme, partial [Fibrobacteres bacterium]|nr:pyridoxal-phosphate dependent enzyme [Fibrobacterota bacterium]